TQLDMAPSRFMAWARVSCASLDSAPCDMAPVEKRLAISAAGSTSSTGIGSGGGASPSRACRSPGPRADRRLQQVGDQHVAVLAVAVLLLHQCEVVEGLDGVLVLGVGLATLAHP